MKRKLIVFFLGYLVGALALAIPLLLSWIMFSGLFNTWRLGLLTLTMQSMYIFSITIITWSQDIKIRMLQNELKERNEKV